MTAQISRDVATPTVSYQWNIYDLVPNMVTSPKRPGYTEHEITLHPSTLVIQGRSGHQEEVQIAGQYISPEGRLARSNTTIRFTVQDTEMTYGCEELPEWVMPYLEVARSLSGGGSSEL